MRSARGWCRKFYQRLVKPADLSRGVTGPREERHAFAQRLSLARAVLRYPAGRQVPKIRSWRRNLTKPQLAMAAAKAWALAEADGRVQGHGGDRGKQASAKSLHLIRAPREHFAAAFGVSYVYIEMARAVLAYSPVSAEQVLTGAIKSENPT